MNKKILFLSLILRTRKETAINNKPEESIKETAKAFSVIIETTTKIIVIIRSNIENKSLIYPKRFLNHPVLASLLSLEESVFVMIF